MEKKETNRVRMYLILSGLFILLIGCTQINENEENVSQLETEESISLEQERFFHDEPHSYRYTREDELLYEMVIEDDEMQKSFRAEEYLEQEIPELDDYEYYINKKSEGQAFLIVESDSNPMELYGEDKKLRGYYYLIYVGEQWEVHRVNWDWFYVREDLEEILWCEIADGTLYSMEDWRESLQYKRRCDMIIDLRNQEKELASLSLPEENENIVESESSVKLESTVDPKITETERILLNHDLLGKDFLNKVGKNLIKSEARIGSEEVKGAFAPTIYESDIFPQELVVMLEKVLYDSCNEEIIPAEESFFFDQTANAMGAEKFMLDVESLYFHFPKIPDDKKQLQWKDEVFEVIYQYYNIPNKCLECFYIPSKDVKDYYVFVYQSGGSDGAVSVCLTERKQDEFVPISEFETQNTGYGKVIQYGEEFYYIFLQYNYNLKVHDGIKIHRLKENPEEENLLIRHLPKQYIWRESQCASRHLADLEVGELIEDYIEEIKAEITSEPYLDSGTYQYGMEVYYGDEKETADFTLGEYEDTVYKIDLANCNVPVYIWKTEYSPSNIGTREFLRTKFYLYDAQTDSTLELEQLNNEFEAPYSIRLVQMWFKEIDGKVYIFRIYHISDYNYMLNVMLLEQDKATQLKAYLLLPQKDFVLTEGEVFTTKG